MPTGMSAAMSDQGRVGLNERVSRSLSQRDRTWCHRLQAVFFSLNLDWRKDARIHAKYEHLIFNFDLSSKQLTRQGRLLPRRAKCRQSINERRKPHFADKSAGSRPFPCYLNNPSYGFLRSYDLCPKVAVDLRATVPSGSRRCPQQRCSYSGGP